MITGNEPISPTPIAVNEYESISAIQVNGTSPGLTIRQHFAAMAMQGLCANSIPGQHHSFERLSFEAVQMADALIKELNK